MTANDERTTLARRRDTIAYHEAGHAVVGQGQGLQVSRVYLGDASGRVIFDDQWSEEAVLGDAALLDRYAMMLLAATSAEWRHTGAVVGATGDIAALSWLLRRARDRGTVPRPDRWRRADAEAERHWRSIEAVADELAHRSTATADLSSVLTQDPQLGVTVDEVSGARIRELLGAQQRDPNEPAAPGFGAVRRQEVRNPAEVAVVLANITDRAGRTLTHVAPSRRPASPMDDPPGCWPRAQFAPGRSSGMNVSSLIAGCTLREKRWRYYPGNPKP